MSFRANFLKFGPHIRSLVSFVWKLEHQDKSAALGGSWVVVISRATILVTHILGLVTPLITNYEPPSRGGWPDTRES